VLNVDREYRRRHTRPGLAGSCLFRGGYFALSCSMTAGVTEATPLDWSTRRLRATPPSWMRLRARESARFSSASSSPSCCLERLSAAHGLPRSDAHRSRRLARSPAVHAMKRASTSPDARPAPRDVRGGAGGGCRGGCRGWTGRRTMNDGRMLGLR
jgi:hypothetical protein